MGCIYMSLQLELKHNDAAAAGESGRYDSLSGEAHANLLTNI